MNEGSRTLTKTVCHSPPKADTRGYIGEPYYYLRVIYGRQISVIFHPTLAFLQSLYHASTLRDGLAKGRCDLHPAPGTP